MSTFKSILINEIKNVLNEGIPPGLATSKDAPIKRTKPSPISKITAVTPEGRPATGTRQQICPAYEWLFVHNPDQAINMVRKYIMWFHSGHGLETARAAHPKVTKRGGHGQDSPNKWHRAAPFVSQFSDRPWAHLQAETFIREGLKIGKEYRDKIIRRPKEKSYRRGKHMAAANFDSRGLKLCAHNALFNTWLQKYSSDVRDFIHSRLNTAEVIGWPPNSKEPKEYVSVYDAITRLVHQFKKQETAIVYLKRSAAKVEAGDAADLTGAGVLTPQQEENIRKKVNDRVTKIMDKAVGDDLGVNITNAEIQTYINNAYKKIGPRGKLMQQHRKYLAANLSRKFKEKHDITRTYILPEEAVFIAYRELMDMPQYRDIVNKFNALKGKMNKQIGAYATKQKKGENTSSEYNQILVIRLRMNDLVKKASGILKKDVKPSMISKEAWHIIWWVFAAFDVHMVKKWLTRLFVGSLAGLAGLGGGPLLALSIVLGIVATLAIEEIFGWLLTNTPKALRAFGQWIQNEKNIKWGEKWERSWQKVMP